MLVVYGNCLLYRLAAALTGIAALTLGLTGCLGHGLYRSYLRRVTLCVDRLKLGLAAFSAFQDLDSVFGAGRLCLSYAVIPHVVAGSQRQRDGNGGGQYYHPADNAESDVSLYRIGGDKFLYPPG